MDFKKIINTVLAKTSKYISTSRAGKEKVLVQLPASEIIESLKIASWIKEGGILQDGVEEFLDTFLPNTQHMHHPHYLGHQVAVPHLANGVSGLINGLINNPMAIYEMGPASAAIEKALINWMLEKVGWFKGDHIGDFRLIKNNGGGVLTHGGSLANLTALSAARARAAPDAWASGTPTDLVVLSPGISHYSIERAVAIMGMGKDAIVPISVDDFGVIQPKALIKTYKEVKNQGKRIMAVVANACSTSTGLYDPLDEIGQFCEENQLWFHVDGAHGASVLISEQKDHLMKGIMRADSLIWDMHKMMQTTALCTAVLLKNHSQLKANFQQDASYLIHEKKTIEFDSLPFTIECTKSGMGTQLFWVLAAEGEQKMALFIENTYDCTLQFYHLINRHPDFHCPYRPESNILCFSYTKYDKDNKFQLAIRNTVVERGNFYITSAEVNGVRYLRITVMNKLTTQEHIKGLMEEIELVAAELKNTKLEWE